MKKYDCSRSYIAGVSSRLMILCHRNLFAASKCIYLFIRVVPKYTLMKRQLFLFQHILILSIKAYAGHVENCQRLQTELFTEISKHIKDTHSRRGDEHISAQERRVQPCENGMCLANTLTTAWL